MATHLVCNQGVCIEPIFIVLPEVNMGFMVYGIGFRTDTDNIFKWAVMTIVI